MSENKRVNVSESKRVNERVYTREDVVEAVGESLATAHFNLLSHNKERIADTLINKLSLKIKTEPEFPPTVRWDQYNLLIQSSEGRILLDMSTLLTDSSKKSARVNAPEFVRRWNAVSYAISLITRDTGENNDRLVVTLFGVLKGEE